MSLDAMDKRKKERLSTPLGEKTAFLFSLRGNLKITY